LTIFSDKKIVIKTIEQIGVKRAIPEQMLAGIIRKALSMQQQLFLLETLQRICS
jgi:hypothetical protein